MKSMHMGDQGGLRARLTGLWRSYSNTKHSATERILNFQQSFIETFDFSLPAVHSYQKRNLINEGVTPTGGADGLKDANPNTAMIMLLFTGCRPVAPRQAHADDFDDNFRW